MTIGNMGHPVPVGNGNLVVVAGSQTMSSREIAELCEKQHAHVMRDIRDMLTQLHGEGGVSKFGDTYRNEQNGQEYPVFNLPKRETLILVSGYNLAMRAKIIDRWQELEDQVRRPVPAQIDVRDPSQLSRIAIQLIEVNRELQESATRLQAEVQAMAPDVAAYKRIANTDGLLNLTEAAKVLGQQPKAFNRWLSVNRYVYRRPGGSLLAYQDRIQSGYLEHKLVLYQKLDGSDGSRDQVMVTRRGISHFAKKLGVSLPDDLFGHSVAAE